MLLLCPPLRFILLAVLQVQVHGTGVCFVPGKSHMLFQIMIGRRSARDRGKMPDMLTTTCFVSKQLLQELIQSPKTDINRS